MSWDSYFEWDGIEIVNASRTAAYARANGIKAFSSDDCDLATVFGTTYVDPVTDHVKADWTGNWFDADEPMSQGFCGFVPLRVTGLAGSTYTAQVAQNISSGGTVSNGRHAHREVKFVGTLVSVDRSSGLYGLDWLTQALQYGWMCRQPAPLRPRCTDIGMRFFVQCPAVCGTGPLHPVNPSPPVGEQSCPDNLKRLLMDSSCIQSPVILAEQELPNCGGYLITVEFIIASESPYIWRDRDLVTDIDLSSLTWANVPIVRAAPRAATADCYLDPSCVYRDPPNYVQTIDQCAPAPSLWQRAKITIPASVVPEVTRVVPRITLEANATATGFVGVKFAETGDEPETDSFAELLIHHIPAGGILTYEGHRDRTKMRCDSRTSIANHLVDVVKKDRARSRDDDLQLVFACSEPVDMWVYRDQAAVDLDLHLTLHTLQRNF